MPEGNKQGLWRVKESAAFTSLSVAKICLQKHYQGLGVRGLKSLLYNTYIIKRFNSCLSRLLPLNF